MILICKKCGYKDSYSDDALPSICVDGTLFYSPCPRCKELRDSPEKMNEFKPIKELEAAYWDGNQNIFVRLVTYAKVGVGLINDWKYVGAFILWLYYALKFTTLFW